MKCAALVFLLAVLALWSVPAARAQEEWIIRESAQSVEETVARLSAAVEQSGGTVVAVINHAAAARSAGLELNETRLVLIGTPRVGTPLIHADPRAAIDLPVRVLVWEDEGGATQIGYIAPRQLAQKYGIEAAAPELVRMQQALSALVEAAVGRSTQRVP